MVRNSLRARVRLALALSGLLLLAAAPTGFTQDIIQTPLTSQNVTTQVNTTSTKEELPGVGHKFELLGAMVRDTDPENAVGKSGGSGGGGGGNEVISMIATPGALGFAYRNLPPGIKIAALDNQLG